MNGISLLILVLLIAMLMGKKKSTYSRITIGSIFGIAFFSIWQFLKYYAVLSNWPELYNQIAFLILGVSTTLISVFLCNLKKELIVTSISAVLFISAMLLTFTAEIKIKNQIAFHSGYFKINKTIDSNNLNTNKTTLFKQNVAGYSVNLPEDWKLRRDKGPLFYYFQLIQNKVVVAEFRPKCFGKNNIAVTDIIANITTANQNNTPKSDFQCFSHGGGFYSCQVDNFATNKQLKRRTWIAIRNDIKKGIELDFIINKNDTSIIKNMNEIISSLSAIKPVNTDAECLGLTEWL